MTSQRKAERLHELAIFDELPEAIRLAMNECEQQPPRPSIVLATLLRGVSPEKIIETIKRSPK